MFNRILSLSITPDNDVTEPVTLEQAKAWLIVENTDNDTLITALIKSVRILLEKHTKKIFQPSTVTFELNMCKPWKLPRLPIQGEITSVESWTGSAYSAVASDSYRRVGDNFISGLKGQIKVIYAAGYSPDEFPEDLRLAMKSEICYRYENRGDKSLDDTLSSTTQTYIANYISYAWQ